MSHIIIELKDESRYAFLIELLRSLNFVRVLPEQSEIGQNNVPDEFGVDTDENFEPLIYADDEEGWAALVADEQRELEANQWIGGTIDSIQ
jgi:hypothetical protein